MDVKPGYKLTELGVIPKDWGVSPLGRLSEFATSGSRGWAAHYSELSCSTMRRSRKAIRTSPASSWTTTPTATW